MQKLALFLNGEKPKILTDFKKYDQIYCTDGGYHYLTQVDIIPDLIIGDFDSIEDLPKDLNLYHAPNQDYTDFDKALLYIFEKGFKKVDVYCANGLQQDHFLGNLTTAFIYKNKIEIQFIDDHQIYYFIESGFKINNVLSKTISLFPFPIAKKVIGRGLKYPLNGMDLDMSENKISTRNNAIDNEISIFFESGNLLLFIER